MALKFKGAYVELREAAAYVEHLLSEGYDADDVIVVTHEENKQDIESLTIAEVDSVSYDKNQSVWDKVKDAFKNSGDEENPLGQYHLDDETTQRYNKTVKNGGYVILAEERNTGDNPETGATTQPPRPGDNDGEETAGGPVPGEPRGNVIPPGFGVGPVVPGAGLSSSTTTGDPMLNTANTTAPTPNDQMEENLDNTNTSNTGTDRSDTDSTDGGNPPMANGMPSGDYNDTPPDNPALESDADRSTTEGEKNTTPPANERPSADYNAKPTVDPVIDDKDDPDRNYR